MWLANILRDEHNWKRIIDRRDDSPIDTSPFERLIYILRSSGFVIHSAFICLYLVSAWLSCGEKKEEASTCQQRLNRGLGILELGAWWRTPAFSVQSVAL